MTINKAIKCRAYPNKEQQRKITVTLDCCRYIYNHMLSRNEKIYKRRSKHLHYNEMQNLIPQMKNYLPWLKDADSQALKYACRQLDAAYKRFFKGLGGYPNYHSKRGKQSYTTTNKSSIKVIDRHHIQIPVVGIVYVRCLRKFPDGAKIGYATVSFEPDGKYYVSVAYEFEIPEPKHNNPDHSIGLDYKINCLYVTSKGDGPVPPKWFNESQVKLIRKQRTLSRKIGNRKGERKSNNWRKQMRRVAKVQQHIANQRKDFLHKESKRLVETYGIIGIEDLSVKELNVDYMDVGNHKAEHNINKAILGAGWNMFTTMLGYKAKERGCKVIKVAKNFKSTETCHVCGRVEPSVSDLKIRKWTCPCCKTRHDRDVNAAICIENEALRLLVAV